MTKTETYKQKFTKESWPGLEAINLKQQQLYGSQEPIHWATIVPYEFGGEGPLWAVECYKSERQQIHFHCMTLGFTNLWYDEAFAEDELNGFGFELTFRHLPFIGDLGQPIWTANLLQNIAKYVFKTRNAFDDYHYMSANGPIRADTDTEITAMAFITDSEMKEIDTPHGHIKFIQIFGLTTREYNDLKQKEYTVEDLLKKHIPTNPLLITDLDRR
jgi:hypothetical protein